MKLTKLLVAVVLVSAAQTGSSIFAAAIEDYRTIYLPWDDQPMARYVANYLDSFPSEVVEAARVEEGNIWV